MYDDPTKQARAALQRVESALGGVSAEAAADVLRALEMAFERLDEIRRQVSDTERNLAAQQALLDERLLRVEHNRVFTLWNTLVGNARNLRRRFGRPPREKSLTNGYAKWVAHEQAALPSADAARAAAERWTRRPKFSLVLAARQPRALAAALESLHNQVYPDWELCAAIGKSCASEVLPSIRDFDAKHPGAVRHIVAENPDFAAALNAAAALAAGDYLSFLDDSVTLAPFALHFLAEAAQSADFDLLYSDEDLLDRSGRRVRPVFKPDWSPDLLASCMYLGPFVTVSREAFRRCRGFRAGYDGAELHDLALRLTDSPARVRHIPKILFHSDLAQRGALCSAGAASARAVEDAIRRRENVAAECAPAPGGAGLLVRRKRPLDAVSAVVCSRSPEMLRNCLRSLRATAAGAVSQVIVVAHEESGPDAALRAVIRQEGATPVSFTGPFHFSAMNNLGAELAQTPNLLFLNDDVEASSGGWVELLAEQLSREEVGVAGAVLWYPSRVIQHAGLVAGLADGVGHAGRHAASSDLWPWLLAARDVSAVTGACLAIRTALFRDLGGFDVAFPNNYNDVDLCFRVRERGLAVVCVPAPGLVHRECQTRRGIVRFPERYRFYRRWADVLAAPDPYYSPALAPTEEIALDLNPGPSGPLRLDR